MLHLAPVVVGIDGEEASVAALEFALNEARLRSTHVRTLCCWPALDIRDEAGQLRCASREQATDILDRVIDDARQRTPPRVPVMREVSQNLAGPALVTASRHAQLIVLGSVTRGRADTTTAGKPWSTACCMRTVLSSWSPGSFRHSTMRTST